MKLDYKKKKIQLQYKEKLQQKKEEKQQMKGAILAIIIIFISFFLDSCFKWY
jgi:hypothetical protein